MLWTFDPCIMMNRDWAKQEALSHATPNVACFLYLPHSLLPMDNVFPYSLQAESLLKQAQAEASRKTGGVREDEEESVVVMTAGGGSTAEGKPGWLVQSPAWASPEARSMEAACVVMKQALDLQAVQV